MNNKLQKNNLTAHQIADFLYDSFDKDFRGDKFYDTYILISSPIKNSLSTWTILFDNMKNNRTLFFSFANIPNELFKHLNEKESVEIVETYLSFSHSILNYLSPMFPSNSIMVTMPPQSVTTILSNTTTNIYPLINEKIDYIKDINNESKKLDKKYSTVQKNSCLSLIPAKLHHPIFQEVYEHNQEFLFGVKKENEFLEQFLILYEKHLMKIQNSELNTINHKSKVHKF